ALPDDDGADLLAELVGEDRRVLHLVVDRCNAGVHRIRMDSFGGRGAQLLRAPRPMLSEASIFCRGDAQLALVSSTCGQPWMAGSARDLRATKLNAAGRAW